MLRHFRLESVKPLLLPGTASASGRKQKWDPIRLGQMLLCLTPWCFTCSLLQAWEGTWRAAKPPWLAHFLPCRMCARASFPLEKRCDKRQHETELRRKFSVSLRMFKDQQCQDRARNCSILALWAFSHFILGKLMHLYLLGQYNKGFWFHLSSKKWVHPSSCPKKERRTFWMSCSQTDREQWVCFSTKSQTSEAGITLGSSCRQLLEVSH